MVKLRPSRNGRGWEYSVIFRWPDGTSFRERRDAPVPSKSGAQRYAEAREGALLAAGKAAHIEGKRPAVPAAPRTTFADFWPRFVRDHYRANRKKPSTIDAAECIFRQHLKGTLGAKPLDAIRNADIAALKGALSSKSAKTVNNVLSVLSRALRAAVEWGDLAAMPCKIGLLKVPPNTAKWYERTDYRHLVDAAARISTSVHVVVLLAGSAGLRRGEIQALKWSDLDLARRLIHVQRAFWRGHEESPKGGRGRQVPMTPELATALKAHGTVRGLRVLTSVRSGDTGRISNRTVRNWIEQAQTLAELEVTGAIHMLRHTFCSHLAAAGAPAKAIQELAGHTDLTTTQRYMHLSPSNRSEAVAALARYHAADKSGARLRAVG